MNYKATIIISVYKNISALRLVLDSLKNQTEKSFEIIISEDGKCSDMQKFIQEYPFENSYQHVRQEDKGWRKTKALNNSVRHAKSDWLIFIDGDCMLHPRFVEMHLKYADENIVLSGRRLKLDKPTTERLIAQQKISPFGFFTKLFIRHISAFSKTQFLEEGFFFPPKSLLHFIAKIRDTNYVLGCNMSLSKKAIYAINGFDESFIEPSVGEDTDIAWRLEAAGYKLKSLRSLAIQYHLFHPQNWTYSQKNHDIMKNNKLKNRYKCLKGLELLSN